MSRQRIRMAQDYEGHATGDGMFHLHIPFETKGIKTIKMKCHGWVHWNGDEIESEVPIEDEFTEEDIIDIEVHQGFIEVLVMTPSGMELPNYSSLVVEFSYEDSNYIEVTR